MCDRSETPGAGAELLAAGGYEMSSRREEATSEVRHTLYFQTGKEALEALAFLRASAPGWEKYGIRLDSFETPVLKKEDWAQSWKVHFKAMEISPRLIVRPSWESVEERPGRIVLTLDPGMSFGTGQHATTRFCLAALDRFAEAPEPPGHGRKTFSFLDAGTGSGILAIAAFKLGYSPVSAFDIDPDSIPVALENARVNGITKEGIAFEKASLESFQPGRRFHIVAANILSHVLIACREKLLSLVEPGGILILAGILDTEYPALRNAFTLAGCEELSTAAEKEWRGGIFRTPGKSF